MKSVNVLYQRPGFVCNFQPCHYRAIRDYEDGLEIWNDLVEKAEFELMECLSWNYKPDFVDQDWWTERYYDYHGRPEPQNVQITSPNILKAVHS